MTKRQIWTLAGLFFGVMLTSCICSLLIINDPWFQEPTPTGTRSLATETPEVTPTLLEFEGSGDKVLAFSSPAVGLALYGFIHEGDGNFIVKLVGASGQRELLVNAIGAYRGERLSLLGEGDYVLEITADGDWAAVVVLPN